MDDAIVLKHLHTARLANYRGICTTDTEVTELYLWNARLASALSEVLGFVEVAVRHALDVQLAAFAKREVGSEDWTHNIDTLPLLRSALPTRVSRRTLYKAADESRKDRPNGHPGRGDQINHDDLVAHVMFGTWGQLLPEKFNARLTHPDGRPVQNQANLQARRDLWKQVLKHAFPYVRNDPRGIGTGNKVRDLRKLRNRVSHMDSLLFVQVEHLHNQTLLSLMNSIDPDLRDWMAAHSRVMEIFDQRPQFNIVAPQPAPA